MSTKNMSNVAVTFWMWQYARRVDMLSRLWTTGRRPLAFLWLYGECYVYPLRVLWKLKIFSWSACKLLNWREKLYGGVLHTKGAATGEGLVMHTTCAFTFIAVSKWHLSRIPASKRICMNVGVFQNKARRKKIHVSCTPEQMKKLAKVRMQSGNA